MIDLLERLHAATTEDERDLVLLEFNLSSLDAALREAVFAAALPRWFDATFLAALLDNEDVHELFGRLTKLSFVEPFPTRGFNVHERTRALLLTELWRSSRDRALELTRRAAEFCERQDQQDVGWRVEACYHRIMLGDQDGIGAFIDQGFAWISAFQTDNLEVLARRLLDDVVRPNDPAVMAWANFFYARVELEYSRYSAAETRLNQAMAGANGSLQLEANCSLSLAHLHIMRSEYLQAREWASRAQKSYAQLNDTDGEAKALDDLAQVSYLLDEYADAKRFIERALRLWTKTGSKLGQANSTFLRGKIHMVLGESQEARRLYDDALALYREIGARKGEAHVLFAIANTLIDDDQQTEEFLGAALNIYITLGDKAGQAYVLAGLGNLNYNRKHLESARNHYEDSLSLAKEIGSVWGEAVSIEGLGKLDVVEGSYQTAWTRFDAARVIFHDMGDRYEEGRSLCLRANVERILEDLQSARESLAAAERLFLDIGSSHGQQLVAAFLRRLDDPAGSQEST